MGARGDDITLGRKFLVSTAWKAKYGTSIAGRR
jgi:hypothetical protein